MPDPIRGLFDAQISGKARVVEYERDSDLSETEQIPLSRLPGKAGEEVEAFIRREVLPYAPDSWMDESKTKVGYEVSFTRHFYKPTPLRSLEIIRADIRALEEETDDLLSEIVR